MSDVDPKVRALMSYFNVAEDAVTEERGDTFTVDGEGEFAVMTDEEADQAWDESLESYIEDCILPEVPAQLAAYFDREAWKRDARYDGRGHCLSPFDGEEHEQKIDGEWFYIYRVN